VEERKRKSSTEIPLLAKSSPSVFGKAETKKNEKKKRKREKIVSSSSEGDRPDHAGERSQSTVPPEKRGPGQDRKKKTDARRKERIGPFQYA